MTVDENQQLELFYFKFGYAANLIVNMVILLYFMEHMALKKIEKSYDTCIGRLEFGSKTINVPSETSEEGLKRFVFDKEGGYSYWMK